jgi:microcystin-dependent protein
MSTCSNCFNGCTEIISDKCVKYTGPNITALGITKGDTLASVEKAITDYLVPVLTGVGVIPIISNSIICETVSKYLPDCSVCTGFTLNQILTAIISAICDLQEQIEVINTELTEINDRIDEIESPYTTECLTGVNSSSNTHDVLQAVISKLCSLALDLTTNYVTVDEIDGYIEDYIQENNNFSLYKNRMVPYTAVPYYGTLSNFDGTGAGSGVWVDVYLCNGQNFTPDLRGRTLVGSTSMLGNAITDPTINPALSGNPAYTFTGTLPPLVPSVTGANEITLGITQIPSHTHAITNVVTVNEEPHSHTVPGAGTGQGGLNAYNNGLLPNLSTSAVKTNLTVSVASTAAPMGQGLPHANIQPSATCYYIMYIP